MANLSAGFFGGINAGWEAQDTLRKQQQSAMEKLRAHQFSEQKHADDMATKAMDDARPILDALGSAGPKEMPGLMRQMEHFVKIYGADLAPDEFSSGTFGEQTSREEAERSTPLPDIEVGQQVQDDYTPGDAVLGVDKLTGKKTRSITPEDVGHVMALREIEVRNKTGKQWIKKAYGSKAAEDIAGFMSGGYQAGLMSLQEEAGSIEAGLGSPVAIANAKNRIYAWGDQVGASPEDIKKLTDRLDSQVTSMKSAGQARDVEIDRNLTQLRSSLGAFFERDLSLPGAINAMDKGERALYNAMHLHGTRLIHLGESNMAQILSELHVAANWYSQHGHEVIGEDGQPKPIEFDGAYDLAAITPSLANPGLVDPDAPPEVQRLQSFGFRSAWDGRGLTVPNPDGGVTVYSDHDAVMAYVENTEAMMQSVADAKIAAQVEEQAEAAAIEKAAADERKRREETIPRAEAILQGRKGGYLDFLTGEQRGELGAASARTDSLDALRRMERGGSFNDRVEINPRKRR